VVGSGHSIDVVKIETFLPKLLAPNNNVMHHLKNLFDALVSVVGSGHSIDVVKSKTFLPKLLAPHVSSKDLGRHVGKQTVVETFHWQSHPQPIRRVDGASCGKKACQ
jgi:hypothetical protein